MVRVVRVRSLPGGLSIFVDDQPDSLVIWVLEDDFKPEAAQMVEAAFNLSVYYWLRKPALHRSSLRAV
ncbi:hypothetical protein [Streptomyces xanthochromogenes]|uniref:hypothetical protein n=1 Tax=Streptomyces xanthochromogenes TaxID=67384 RepID=UPI002F3F81C0